MVRKLPKPRKCWLPGRAHSSHQMLKLAFLSTNEPLCGGDARPREGVLVFPRAEAHLSSLTAGENRTLSRASSVDLSFTRDTQVHWGTGDWSRKGKQGQAFGGFEVKI